MGNKRTGEDPTEAQWVPMKPGPKGEINEAGVRNPHSPANEAYFKRNPNVKKRLIEQGY